MSSWLNFGRPYISKHYQYILNISGVWNMSFWSTYTLFTWTLSTNPLLISHLTILGYLPLSLAGLLILSSFSKNQLFDGFYSLLFYLIFKWTSVLTFTNECFGVWKILGFHWHWKESTNWDWSMAYNTG